MTFSWLLCFLIVCAEFFSIIFLLYSVTTSVWYVLLSPSTANNWSDCTAASLCSLTGRKLFRRAIIQGGSATASWAVSEDHRAYTAALAERLNCTSAGHDDDTSASVAASRLIIHCLRQVRIVFCFQTDNVWWT